MVSNWRFRRQLSNEEEARSWYGTKPGGRSYDFCMGHIVGTSDMVLNVSPIEPASFKFITLGVSKLPKKNHQSELEALETLLSRGVITQEQFDQLSILSACQGE
jgi:hypothetical protein